MRYKDLLNRSARSLKNAKLRTLLTALAIAVGGFTLFLTLAAGNGVREYTTNLISSNFDPSELIVGRDEEITNNGAPSDEPQEYDPSISSFQTGLGDSAGLQIKQVTREDINLLKANPDVEQVRETFNLTIRYVTREGQKKYTGSAEAYNPAQKPEVAAGEIPAEGDITTGTILLPDVYVDKLGFSSNEEALGQNIEIATEEPFSVEALSRATQSAGTDGSLNINDIDTSSFLPNSKKYVYTIGAVTKRPVTSLAFGTPPLLLSTSDAREIYEFTTAGTSNFDQFVFVNVKVEGGEDKETIDRVKADLEEQGFYVQSSEDIQQTITQFVDILQGAVLALGLVTLVASVFGIVNTQYISVLERTREIGLIKALGMSSRKVRTLFIFEAMWIGFIGGIIGIVLAFVLGLLVNPLITDQLNLGEGNYLIIFSVSQALVLLLSLMLVAALAGFFPARKAAKLDPVEALRTE